MILQQLFQVCMITSCLIATTQESSAASAPHNPYNRTSYDLLTESRGQDGRAHFGDYSISRKAQLLGSLYKLWPAAILPYKFQDGLDQSKQQAFISACQKWTVGTPLQCQAWSGNGPYFTVRERIGRECDDDINTSTFQVSCTNGLGAPLSTEKRFLSVHPRSWGDQVLLQHEIGHIIGFMHEQQRSDRDGFLIYAANNVTFTYNNVFYDNRPQFTPYDTSDYFSDYDYFSIMHYRNCAFTSPGAGCKDDGDFSVQAIAPRQCDKHAIGYPNSPGGAAITALDRESVEKAYIGRLMAAFQERRDGQCGSQVYSPEQIGLVCGPNCGSASAINWNRITKGYSHKWCTGAFTTPLPNGQGLCQGFGQDYYSTRKTSTKYVDQCVLEVTNEAELNEEWIECGCRSQNLASSCIGSSPKINEVALNLLLASKYQRDVSAGQLLTLMIDTQKSGKMSPEAGLYLLSTMRREYIRPYFGPRGRRLVGSLRNLLNSKSGANLIDLAAMTNAVQRSNMKPSSL